MEYHKSFEHNETYAIYRLAPGEATSMKLVIIAFCLLVLAIVMKTVHAGAQNEIDPADYDLVSDLTKSQEFSAKNT